jgi:hypothetical protein
MFGCGPSAQWLLEIQLRHGPLIRLAAIEPSLNYGPTKVLNCSTASAGSGKRNIKLTTINNPSAKHNYHDQVGKISDTIPRLWANIEFCCRLKLVRAHGVHSAILFGYCPSYGQHV